MDTQTLVTSGVAAVAAMFVGGLWYSPIMFGNTWKRLAQVPDDADANPAKTYGLAFVLIYVAALIFGAFIGPNPALGFALGAGLSAGIAWAAGTLWISYLFEARSLKLGLINGAYHVIQYTLYGLCFALL